MNWDEVLDMEDKNIIRVITFGETVWFGCKMFFRIFLMFLLADLIDTLWVYPLIAMLWIGIIIEFVSFNIRIRRLREMKKELEATGEVKEFLEYMEEQAHA